MATTGEHVSADRAKFHAMSEGTAEDWSIIAEKTIEHFYALPDRLLAHLRLLEGDYGGFAVDRLAHSLQTATRAYRDNRDDEYVFCALVHDIGDTLGPANHQDIAAAVVKPFVSEKNHWMVEKHAIFQGYYFFQFVGLDPDMREQYRSHPYYDYTAEFCSEYDQVSFDPGYDTLPLAHFEPLVRSQVAMARQSIYNTEA